jgi:hypothetical protein
VLSDSPAPKHLSVTDIEWIVMPSVSAEPFYVVEAADAATNVLANSAALIRDSQVAAKRDACIGGYDVLKCFVERLAKTMLMLYSTGPGRFSKIAGVIEALIARLNAARLCRLPMCRLSMVLLLASSAAAHGQSSAWDKRPEYRQAGYTELTGADAARFLVGNSVIVPEEKDGTMIVSDERIYYFLDDHTMYQCGRASEGSCELVSWSVSDSGICFGIGGCDQPFAVFRSPKWQDWERQGGRLGIYLSYDHVAYEIVKGNWTNGPLFDTRVSGHAIELDRNDFAKEAAEATQFNLPDGQIRIYGSRALSLLIGNTFLSGDARAGLKDRPEYFCPEQGEYYSREGFVLRFTCNRQSHSWSIGITRWRVVSGMLCRDELESIEKFGCGAAVVTAIPAPRVSAISEKMSVLNYNGGELIANALTGYSGNIFNFKFDGSNK